MMFQPALRALFVGGVVVAGLAPGCDCSGTVMGSGQRCTMSTECPIEERCIDGVCRLPGDERGCQDADGDFFGEGCSEGPDCDDANPQQTGREICDGFDNDCDGVADNGVLSPCGNCDASCSASGRGAGGAGGAGGGMPFDPGGADESEGVGVDDDGALVLDSSQVNTDFIWIANTGEGTVSRFSTEAPFPETGRFVTGPDGEDNDPSRTSVNTLGDVYVANRDGSSASRISILGDRCPDTNGDGEITTSSDGSYLPWGQDDCVLWNRELEDGKIRAVAAQDVIGPDGELREYVWVGGWNSDTVWKLDGATGEVLVETTAPVKTYGFALDAAGNLWISGRAQGLGRLDTNRCIDNTSCDVEICDETGDDCVKQRIPAPNITYGITVDFAQRVWIGGNQNDSTIKRYDPAAPLGERWFEVPQTGTHGIAADGAGFVWAAGANQGVIRVDADSGEYLVVPETGGANNKGMAIDSDGKVWSITRGSEAIVVEPGPTLAENTVTRGVADTIVNPYTYSDMTGLQLRLATNPRGYYRAIFEGCPEDGSASTDWDELRFEAETPAGTSVTFRVRTAPSRAELDAATWVPVAQVPGDTSPASIRDALAAAGIAPGRWLMVEAQLIAERMSLEMVITPRVLGVNVTYLCPPLLE